MSLKLWNTAISKLYLWNTAITKAYLWNTLVFSSTVSNGLLNNLRAYYSSDTSWSMWDSTWTYNMTVSWATYNATWFLNWDYSYDWVNDKASINSNLWIDWWSVSISLWVKRINNRNNNTGRVIFTTQSSVSKTNYYFYYFKDWSWKYGIQFMRGKSNVWWNWYAFIDTTETILTQNTRLHLVLTYNSSTSTISWYINNSLKWTASASWSWSWTPRSYSVIWCLTNDTSDLLFYDWPIDEVWVWGSVLDTTKIWYIYNSWVWLWYSSFTT